MRKFKFNKFVFNNLLYRNVSYNNYPNIKMDSEESTKFLKLSNKWYSKEMAALQTMNKIRIPWIVKSVVKSREMLIEDALILQNVNILDIGCGGGILSEPLARLGANVTGIDTVRENIDFAKNRICNQLSKNDKLKIDNKIKFIHTDLESLISLKEPILFDAIIASELLEHVQDWPKMIENVSQLLKPHGIFFATTINRTLLSSLLAVHLAERWIVPVGTHDWNKFIEPEELSRCLKKNNLHVLMTHGMMLNPLTLNWRWISNTSVNYAMEAIKL